MMLTKNRPFSIKNFDQFDMQTWKLYFDGSCSKDLGSAAGVILINPGGEKHTFHQDLGKQLTCNQSEYAALITGLELAREKNIKVLQIFGDSKLVCNQVTGNWEVRSPNLTPYYEIVQKLIQDFDSVQIEHILRGQNQHADAAAKKND